MFFGENLCLVKILPNPEFLAKKETTFQAEMYDYFYKFSSDSSKLCPVLALSFR